MNPFATLHGELRDAEAQARQVVHIRVSKDALRGSITTTPITPERARTIALRLYPGDVVDADLAETDQLLEIVMHPDDWRDLRVEKDEITERYGVEIDASGTFRVWGVRVVEERTA